MVSSLRGDHVDSSSNDVRGIVHGSVVQIGTAYLNTTQPLTDHPPVETWADLPTIPPEVHSLMSAQLQAAQELPYRLPGARRPSLATI